MEDKGMLGGRVGEDNGQITLPLPDAVVSHRPEQERARLASRAFHFPYPTAYPIQLDLMRAVFETIEAGQIGLFESPTGTGKSLSLICAACSWLEANGRRHVEGQDTGGPSDEPDWVRQHAMTQQRTSLQQFEEDLQARMAQARQRRVEQRKRAAAGTAEGSQWKRKRTNGPDATASTAAQSDSDDDYLVDEVISTGGAGSRSSDPDDPTSFLSADVRALMAQTGAFMGNTKRNKGGKPFYARTADDGEGDDEPETVPKIVYTSRTHSQLSQFIGELSRTDFGGAQMQLDILEELARRPTKSDDESFFVRTVSLGSRKQMCINPSVVALGQRAGIEAMNERCLDLMKRKTGTETKVGCSYLPSGDETGQSKMLDYRDNVLATVHDIEEAVTLGRQMHICPYFGARSSARQAHIVTLPYNLLLNAAARTSLNIDLRGSIVIVDEAHNLIDTILATHTVQIDQGHVQRARQQVQAYLDRFAVRLRGSNEVNLKKLLVLLKGLDDFGTSWSQTKVGKGGQKEAVTQIMRPAEMMRVLGGNADQINIMELDAWLRQSKIAHKVAGYADRLQRQADAKEGKARSQRSVSASSLQMVEQFLLSTVNRDLDGRIFVSSDLAETGSEAGAKSAAIDRPRWSFKYQLLNPADVFAGVVEQARSVILAGGTMEPVSDFTGQLFPTTAPAQLRHFSCAHIIPPQNLMAAIVGKGAKGGQLEFRYDARGNPGLLDELTATLINYSSVIPHGVVVFLPSYGFLDALVQHWNGKRKVGNSNGDASAVDPLARLSAKKRIFYEPKEASQVETVLRDYTLAIEQSPTQGGTTGAILFAVVGAKLSEGINFSDRLARAVIMVGMPFANVRSPELNERMRYVRELATAKGKDQASTTTPSDPGQELYVNICMKAVNQSIGRAIRHRNDYAALIFLDRRYGRADIRASLPQWIRQSTQVYDAFGPSMAALGAFFRTKREPV